MNTINILLFLISILVLIYVNYTQVKKDHKDEEYKVSGYNLIDTFMDYKNYLTIPSTAYDKAFNEGNKKYFVEFDDKHFRDILENNIHNQKFDYTGYEEEKKYNKIDIQHKVSATIEGILNKHLPIDEVNIFNVVDIKIDKVMVLKVEDKKKYVVSATSLIHRLNKAYGLYISTESYHDGTMFPSLISYKLHGFIFEDKLDNGNVLPSNIEEHSELSYDDIMRDKIMKDKKYEHDTFCKYITDLKKFRNIEYPGGSGCS